VPIANFRFSNAPTTWIGWMLIAALVLYPLSIGPAYLFCDKYHSRSNQRAFYSAYWPIVWACWQSETCDGAIQSYIDLWQGPPTPPNFPAPQSGPSVGE
jgi:hypothetical protein